MLTVVFSKMEVRRMGYALLKDSRYLKTLNENKRQNQMTLASLTRPERIENYAQKKLSLKRADKGQIVQISGERIVLRN
jgi:cell division protein FtsL